MCADSGHQRGIPRASPGAGEAGDDRQAPGLHPPGGRSGSGDRVPAGDFLRAVLLRRAECPVVRFHRAGPRRAHHPFDAGDGEASPHGADRSGLRAGDGGRLLQRGGGDRRGRQLPREVPQDAHPARSAWLLGEILLPAGQPGLSGVRPGRGARSACISATTGTSRRERGRWV